MSGCNGCKNYQPVYETCRELAGGLRCKICDITWSISDGVNCPSACGGGYSSITELGDCTGAKPARACPGFEVLPPIMGQLRLFD